MRMRLRASTILLCLIALAATTLASPNDSLHALQARMDKAANEFKSMTSQVAWVTHTDVLNEDSTETGKITMKKVQAGEVQGLVEFIAPDKKFFSLGKQSLRIFIPKIKTVQVFELGDQADLVDQFVMIGFGTSGTTLARDYEMKVLPAEPVQGQPDVATIRLELIPKAGKVRELIKKVELWIPERGDPYPIQEKISQSSGDYRLVTYSDLKINPPLKPDAVQLKLPPGVKTEYPGK